MQKEDLRVKRTRKLLSESLIDLLSKKDFSKINVNDICENAMIHRATFYNHFYDKEDLLNYTLDEIQEDLFEKSIENTVFNNSKEMYISLMSTIFDFLIENKVKIISIIRNNSEKLTTTLVNTIKKSINYLISKNKFKEQYTLPIEVIVNFYTGGFSMLGLDWIEHTDKYSKEDLLNFCNILFNEEGIVKK